MRSNRMAVLVHTAAGLVFLGPYLAYRLRHWRIYREARLTHVKLTGCFSLAATATCGTAGCPEEIAAEWPVGAHRWSAMDAGFRVVQATMGAQNRLESTRYCAGCHDPDVVRLSPGG